MTTTVLRPAGPDDHDAIVALPELGASTCRLLAADLAGSLPRHAVVAVDGDGRVVGFAMANRQPDEVHLLDIAVAPRARRTGVAMRLVARLAARSLADGTTAMTLEVRASNAGGRSLYRCLGFVDRGARPGYYQDGEDARILWHRDLVALAARSAPGDRGPAMAAGDRSTSPTSHLDAITGRGR